METKHTPGPWKVMYSTGTDKISCLAVWPADTEEGDIGSPVCKLSPEHSENDEDRANARLIAAAPELLQALGKTLAELELVAREANYTTARWHSEHTVPVHALIAKVRGEATAIA